MGLIFLFAAISLVIGVWMWMAYSGDVRKQRESYLRALESEKDGHGNKGRYSSGYYKKEIGLRADVRRQAALLGVIIPAVVSTIVACAVIGHSFDSYSTLRAQYDATVNQYRGAVTMYADRADLNVQKAAFTDFVYKGYQGNIAGFVRDLRSEVLDYNRKLVRKRVWNKNWFFGWVIVAPDKDMLIINMLE